jgi:isopenicillin N synthase-like dioxygenase
VIIYTPPKSADRIPIIDLAAGFSPDLAERQKVAWEIHKACRETGFFYVANHGIADTLIDDQFRFAKRFFELPLAEKLTLDMKKSPSKVGYEPIGTQVLDSQDDGAEKAPQDLKESFQCAMELPDDHPLALSGLRGFGHNQWPSDLPGFKEQTLAYQAAVRALGDRILRLMALSLELPEDFFLSVYDTPGLGLRLLHYPPQPAEAKSNQIGAGAHTDWGGITLLAQDSVGGLEVRNATGEWIAAKPIPGTIVINLGDLMARWTNGLYNSNAHRVMNNGVRRTDRYSIAFFYSPRPTAVIEALPTCVAADRPPQFKTCTAQEHMDEMFRRSYGYAVTTAEAAPEMRRGLA